MFEHTRAGAVDVIHGPDPINLQHSRQLADVLTGCLVLGQPRLVLDCERIPLIDSAGLELLLDFQENCAGRGGTIKLAALSPLCREILSITEVLEHFEVFHDRLSAVGSFAQ